MESEPLARACELAFAVARQGVEATPPIEPPVAMRSFLYVPQLPRRAMSVAQRVIDEDPEFRSRVAAQATEQNVGRDGYLWLHRPSGWDSDPSFGRADTSQLVAGQAVPRPTSSLPDLSKHAGQSVLEPIVPDPVPSPDALAAPATAPVPPPAPPSAPAPSTGSIPPPPPPPPPASPVDAAPAPSTPSGAPAPADTRASIEEELASLRGLVARLAEERQNTTAPVAGLETEVEERRAESNALATQLTSANSDLQNARAERDRAMTDREGLLARQRELEAELQSLRAQIEQSRTAAADVEAERTNTLTSLEQAQADLADAQRLIGEAAETESGLRNQLDAAVAERDAAWRDASSLRVERDQLSDRVRVAEQARVDLEAQLDDVSGQWQELKVEIQTLADERRAVEAALDDLARTRETSAAERRSLFNDLASQLGQVEAERDHLASQIDIMRARITGTRSALDTATQSLSGEVDSADAAANESVAAIGNLDATLGQVHERLTNLGSAIDSELSSPTSTDAEASPSFDVETSPSVDGVASDAAEGADAPGMGFGIPQPPMPPGAPDAEIEIGGFLPDDVEIEQPTGRTDATLFGNPREMKETHLFGDPAPATDETDDTDDEIIDAEMADAEFVADKLADADEIVDDEMVDAEFVAPATGEAAIEDAFLAGDDDLDPVDDDVATSDVASFYDGRSSADDDQALANVMASYGFGADDDETDAPVDESDAPYGDADEATDEVTFDISDTSSFIDPDAGRYEPVAEPSAMIPDDAEARRIASTPDMVMLIDGDAAATMGWRDSALADRRRYLLEKLDQVTGEYGPAVDVVFDPAVGGEDQMPAPTKVRRRLIQPGMTPGQKLSELVDSYPSHFPIAVVSDQDDLKAQMRLRSVETLDVVQLLDLIVNLPEVD
ncbi:MAG: hypothetical protein R2733_20865 [Acidimicrobiales bacterium]